MNCNTTKKWAGEYLDGTLSDERKKELESHLDTCPECLKYVNDLRQMLRLLASMEEEEPPEGFRERLNQRLHSVEEKRVFHGGAFAPGGKWVKWGAGLAAAVALLLSIHFLDRFGGFGGRSGSSPLADSTTENDFAGNDSMKSEQRSESAKISGNTTDSAQDAAEDSVSESQITQDPASTASPRKDKGNTAKLTEAPAKSPKKDNISEKETPGTPESAEAPTTLSGADENTPQESMPEEGTENTDANGGPKESSAPKFSVMMRSAAPVTTDSAIDISAFSGELNLYIGDASDIKEKISVIAAGNGITVAEESEDTVTLRVTNEKQSDALHAGLSKLGRVEDLGVSDKEDTVTIHIIVE